MKTLTKIFGGMVIIIIAIWARIEYLHFTVSRENFTRQVGAYKIDARNSELGDFQKDSADFLSLHLIFKEDGTFQYSKSVKFIFDSTGDWIPANNSLGSMGVLRYRRNSHVTDQFSRCCATDSSFIMESVTPREGDSSAPIIYFKKIKPIPEDLRFNKPVIGK